MPTKKNTPTKRPAKYTKTVAAEVCKRLAEGQSIRQICADKQMPSHYTIYKWIGENEKFAEQYARAREDQAEYYAEEIVEIADTEVDPQKARVRIDARKWVAAKLKPRKYGERVHNEHSGNLTITTVDYGSKPSK